MPLAGFEVVLDRRALKEYQGLPEPMRGRFRNAFAQLEQDPFVSRSGCDIRVLEGAAHLRAIRVGRYRAIFAVQGRVVRVVLLGKRGTIYDR